MRWVSAPQFVGLPCSLPNLGGPGGAGTRNECDETNNVHWYAYITGPEGPDLTVPRVDAGGTSTDPRALTIAGTASAQIANQGSTTATAGFDITFFEDVDGNSAFTPGTDNVLGQTRYSGGLAPGATASAVATVSGEVRFVGSPLWAFADSRDVIPELDEANNLNHTATQCQVNAAPAPDLTLSHLRGEPAGPVDLTVRVANTGEAAVPPGIPVHFHLGNPGTGGTLLGSITTSKALAPGTFEDVAIRWTDESTGSHIIFVTVDAAGECNEANNTYPQRVDILDIPLVESCNLISGWVQPHNTNMAIVQRPISGTYVVIQGFDQGARSYYPDLPPPVNTLKDMEAEYGYWIKIATNDERRTTNSQSSSSVFRPWSAAEASATLRLVGTGWPENRPVELDAGWNLVSFLSRSRMGVVEGLRSIDGQYTAVLGFDRGALSYYPHLAPGFNTLSVMEPLRGYWMRLIQASTLRYPRTRACGAKVAEVPGVDPEAEHRAQLARQAEQATWVRPTNTWVNFYGPATRADGQPVQPGALVLVYDPQGVPCGAGIVTTPGQYGLLACYGDDPTTPEDEGAVPGDVLSFTIGGQPAPASQAAVWTAHGNLRLAPLGPASVWRVWLPVIILAH